jgi:hypothetical protein
MKTAAVFQMPLSSFEGTPSFTVIVPENGDFKKATREIKFTMNIGATSGQTEKPSVSKAKGGGKPKAGGSPSLFVKHFKPESTRSRHRSIPQSL